MTILEEIKECCFDYNLIKLQACKKFILCIRTDILIILIDQLHKNKTFYDISINDISVFYIDDIKIQILVKDNIPSNLKFELYGLCNKK